MQINGYLKYVAVLRLCALKNIYNVKEKKKETSKKNEQKKRVYDL